MKGIGQRAYGIRQGLFRLFGPFALRALPCVLRNPGANEKHSLNFAVYSKANLSFRRSAIQPFMLFLLSAETDC